MSQKERIFCKSYSSKPSIEVFKKIFKELFKTWYVKNVAKIIKRL